MAELIAQETIGGISRQAIERELRRFVFQIYLGRDVVRYGQMPEDAFPPLDELPPASVDIGRNQLAQFCEVKGWPLPRFWFPDQQPERRPRGRPSDKGATVQEFRRRLEAGEDIAATVTEQARLLRAWMAEQGMQEVQIPTIVRWLQGVYRP